MVQMERETPFHYTFAMLKKSRNLVRFEVRTVRLKMNGVSIRQFHEILYEMVDKQIFICYKLFMERTMERKITIPDAMEGWNDQ